MLTVQPKVFSSYKPAFKSDEFQEDNYPTSLADMDQDTYDKVLRDLRERKGDFLDLTNNKEFKLPGPAKKLVEGGAVITTGLLGGMATGWGAKKSIQAFSKIFKSAPVKGFVNYVKSAGRFVKRTLSTVKKLFLESELYKKPANAIKKQYNKFAETKFGKSFTKYFGIFKEGAKKIYLKVKNSVKSLWTRAKAVKNETYEKAAVNTVGVAGGAASGITALTETQEKNKRDEESNADVEEFPGVDE